MDIKKILLENVDEKYAEFQRKLIPNIDGKKILGVRTPILRKIAKDFSKDESCKIFLNSLPHKTFEENQLHSFILCEMKNFDECIVRVEEFLPYVDNWATCDQLAPKVFRKNKEKLIPYINKWLESEEIYTVRFGIEMAMSHFLDEDFRPEFFDKIIKVKSDDYYVKMMVAWFFATALAKQWDETIKIIESKKLEPWTQNKTVQKAKESHRITKEQENYLIKYKVIKEEAS